jgi:hypothetical protein
MKIESRKGENVPKQEKVQAKQLKSKKNFQKNNEEGIKSQIMDNRKFENKSWYVQQRT